MKYLRLTALEVVPPGPIDATFVAPTSKSYTNRALLLASLAEGESRIRRPLQSDDTARMREALAAFGAEIAGGDAIDPGGTSNGPIEVQDAGGGRVEVRGTGGAVITVRGTGGHLRAPESPVDCGLSGTTIRFLTAVAALAEGETVLTGAPPLLRRPIAPLASALQRLGAEVRYLGEAGFPPVAVRGPLAGGEAEVDASGSSQFLTALLMVAPYAREDVRLHVTALASRPYIEMTRASMARFGVLIEGHEDGRYQITAGRRYEGRDYEVEYDASSAAHLFALAATTGGRVTVDNAAPGTMQADSRFTDYLAAMGCAVGRDGSRLTVAGPGALKPITQDLSGTPDMTTPLAVACAYAEGVSHLYNIEMVRGHETDRLAATAAELRKLGVEVEDERDGLRIAGGVPHGGRIATYHDHRMAMGFAAAGARTPGVVIEDPGCVAKTFPGFWDALAAAGISLQPIDR